MRIRSRVVLPQPDSPMMQETTPSGKERFSPSNTGSPWKDLDRFSTAIMAAHILSSRLSSLESPHRNTRSNRMLMQMITTVQANRLGVSKKSLAS